MALTVEVAQVKRVRPDVVIVGAVVDRVISQGGVAELRQPPLYRAVAMRCKIFVNNDGADVLGDLFRRRLKDEIVRRDANIG